MTDLVVLTRAEAIALSDCESRIEHGMKTYVEVGLALGAIRENKLYRAEHETFEAYCAARWNFTGRRGRQLIEAAEIGNMFPVENSRQAAELAAVPEADRADVLAEATEQTNGKPTAAAIRDAAKARTQSPGPADPTTSPADPGASPAPATESPVLAEQREPGPTEAEAPREGGISTSPAGRYRNPQPEPGAEERRQRLVATHQICEVVVAVAQMRGFDTGWKYDPAMALPGRPVTTEVLTDARQAIDELLKIWDERGLQ